MLLLLLLFILFFCSINFNFALLAAEKCNVINKGKIKKSKNRSFTIMYDVLRMGQSLCKSQKPFKLPQLHTGLWERK